MELIELGSILHMEKGKKPKAQSTEPAEGYLPYVDIKAFEQGVIDHYATIDKSLLCEDGELLIVCDGSRSGLTGRAIKGVVGSTLSKIYADGTSAEYLRFFIQSKYTLLNTQKKGTGTPHLNVSILKSSKLLVPPLAKQKRIVARIEELFSMLDKAVETLQTTQQQLAVYRQAVLKGAFEGKLTNQFAFQNKTVGDYIEKPKYGTSKKCTYQFDDGFVPVIRIPNIDIQNGSISHSDMKYASFNRSELNALSLEAGDILMIRSNGSVSLVGASALIRECDTTCLFAGYLMRLRIIDQSQVLPKYLLWWLFSYNARVYIERVAKSTSGVNNINAQEVANIPFPYVPTDQQSAIVYEIESRLSVCDSIEQTVCSALAQAEALKQSILKRAFEGELA